MDKFRKLGISEEVVKAIEEHRFSEPSEIQEKAIPLILEGKDVVAGSATGSGKTLVFGAGIIQKCEHGKKIQALVLTPTRELAEQITRALRNFAKYKKLNIIPVYGGVSINPQIEELKTADVVVGTPGRILDHISQDTLETDNVKILVLDEADRMLDMGFIKDVSKILSYIPKKRQTMLFSATIDADIAYLARMYLSNPVEISAESYVDASKLHQVYYEVPAHLKFSLLVHMLAKEHTGLVMVFCNTRSNTDFVAKNLKYSGIDALAIHGGFSQEKRTRVMDSFRTKHLYVLVCTDVAARGLDIKGVSHVYNYDLPKDSKEYIHRIGRTARAGKEGKAVSLLSDRDFENFRNILKNRDLNVIQEPLPSIVRVPIKWFDTEREGGFNRGRGSRGFNGNRGRGGGGGRRFPRREERDNRDNRERRGSYSGRRRF
jgi:ATP-dependent RNA helicase DeaD